MSFESKVIDYLKKINTWINETVTNAKKIEELPIQQNIVPTSKVHVSNNGVSESLEVSKILEETSNNTYSNGLTLANDNVTLGGKLTKDTYLPLEPSGDPQKPRKFVVGEARGKRLEVSEKNISLNSDFVGIKSSGDVNIKTKQFSVFNENERHSVFYITKNTVYIDASKRTLYLKTSNGVNRVGDVLTKLNENGETGFVPAPLNPFTSIDGYLVNKRANKDYSKIEVGDQIQGNYSDKRYIIADVVGLPYTNENNLEFYIDNEK